MPRFNKILLGPTRKNDPQVKEAIASVALKPGRLITLNASGQFVLATATTTTKVYLCEKNYLALKSVDDDWVATNLAIGYEMQPDVLYAGRVAAGVNITQTGLPLTLGANGTLAIATGAALVIGHSDEAFNNNTGVEQLVRFRPAAQAYRAA